MPRLIETPRLLLRPPLVSDAADVFEWVSDPVVNRYMPYTLYESEEQAAQWLASLRPEDNDFAFCLKDTGKVIGTGGVSPNADSSIYELGYNLNRAYWGQGYATEAAKAMLTWAHDSLNAHDFVASHVYANVASGKVLRKCGFVFEHFGQYARFDGSETFDATFYRLQFD